jgi:membrane-associated protease RseP (regulator of RpoE activity)
MPLESQSFDPPEHDSGPQNSTACPNCRAVMPMGMRFCRACGFRLGEGVEEYTETVRFGAPGQPRPATASAHSQTTPFGASDWGAMSPAGASQVALGKKRKSKGPHWIVWVILAIIIASVAGGSFMRPLRFSGPASTIANAPQSKVGAQGFTSVDGGAMVDAVTPPGGPLDKAGLVGGDVITSFDGQPVNSEASLKRQIGATPIGKTVEIVYTRDGEVKKALLTTISEDEMDRLTDIAGNIPDGFFGIEDLDRVAVPNTNIYGVQLGSVSRNRPAYMSGLRQNDIIIEIEGIPIRTPEELGARIDRATPDSTVKVIVMRGNERIEIPVKVGIDD